MFDPEKNKSKEIKQENVENIIRDKSLKKKKNWIFWEFFIHYFRIIVLFVVILILVLFGYTFWTMYQNNVVELQQLIKQKQDELNNKQMELEEVQKIQLSYEDLEGESKKIFEALPSEESLPSVYIQLEELAIKNNLVLEAVDLGYVAEKVDLGTGLRSQTLGKVTINLSLSEGNYFTLKNYLIDIEKNIRLMDITGLIYDPSSNTYNLTLNTYYFSQNYKQDKQDE